MAILSDICEYGKGKTKVSELNKNTYISTENMLANKGGVVVASSIPSTKMVSKIMPGDVIVSNIRPYFKKIWYAREEGGCSNDVLIFRAKPGTDNKFLYYVLADDKFFDYVMSSAKGTKMPRGDKSAIMKYEVPEYSLNLQHKIAKFLSRIDTKIEVNEKINRNLSEQVSSIYRSWFVDFDRNDGECPDDWTQATLEDIAEITSGKRPPNIVNLRKIINIFDNIGKFYRLVIDK